MAMATPGEEGLLKQMTIRNEEHGAYLPDAIVFPGTTATARERRYSTDHRSTVVLTGGDGGILAIR
jgi:hypothetical protein